MTPTSEELERLVDILLEDELGGQPADLTGKVMAKAFPTRRAGWKLWAILAGAAACVAIVVAAFVIQRGHTDAGITGASVSVDPPSTRALHEDKEHAIARGRVVGAVKAKGYGWVEVTSLSGKTERYVPEWVGGAPSQGGAPEKQISAQINGLAIGARVQIEWYINDHVRIESITELHE